MSLLIDRIVAPYYQTNCWVIAPSAGEECFIVDPGIELPSMVESIKSKLKEHHLSLGAILVTHGHLDHTFSIFSLTQEFGDSGTYIHDEDRDLLRFPERALSQQSLPMFSELREKFPNTRIDEPEKVYALKGDEKLSMGAMNIHVIHTPGHTPGSLVFQVDDEVLISGDTLFAGSIGRTDLPRGSISDMERSLREKIAPLPPHLRVLPGHGNETRMERELKGNPYLRQAITGTLQ
jgi:glyoxylase-like metal-dependent hydrolase (beta-lactamase superfamily II)